MYTRIANQIVWLRFFANYKTLLYLMLLQLLVRTLCYIYDLWTKATFLALRRFY